MASAGGVYVGGDLGYGSPSETSVHGMIGIRELVDPPMVLELSSGLTTSRISLADGRTYWSVQPAWLPTGGAVGTGIGLFVAMAEGEAEAIPMGFGIGWIASQIASNCEMRFGTKYASGVGAHQVDWLVPGWHPREKLSLGIQLGDAISFRALGTRSFASIESLNRFGFEFRVVANAYHL